MTDEQKKASESGDDADNNVDNKLDSLLPVPSAHSDNPPEHSQVDGPIDEVLPSPGKPDLSEDDASTREELEVDTSADGVDDFIPLHGDEPTGSDHGNPSSSSNQCLICGQEIGAARFCPECGTEQVPASRILAKMAPLFMWSRPLTIRVTLSIGALLTLLALLADDGTSALIIFSSTLPIVILIRLSEQLRGLGRSTWVQAAMMGLVGTAVGLPISWLAARIVRQSWFDGGVFNFGASSFGGIAVETVGNAPLLVWITSGLLLPLVMILTIGSAPAALRMALGMPPRESSGMFLSASVAAGYIVGAALAFYFPLYSQLGPIMSTSEWTLTILGIAVIRPVIWVYSGAMVGTVVWRYLQRDSLPEITIPAFIAVGFPVAFSLASLAIAPVGLWAAVTLGILFAVVSVLLQMRVVAPI